MPATIFFHSVIELRLCVNGMPNNESSSIDIRRFFPTKIKKKTHWIFVLTRYDTRSLCIDVPVDHRTVWLLTAESCSFTQSTCKTEGNR